MLGMLPMARFFQYHLRTTDVSAARAFYAAVLGTVEVEIFQLHEQALARGARPHWLGYIDVADVDATASAFAARGATPLGPKWVNPQGLEAAVMRDPGGAILALAKPAASNAAPGPEVAWHALNTRDLEGARANYQALFGWQFAEPIEIDGIGSVFPFAWGLEDEILGSISDITERPAVHPHWTFHFRVPDLEPALAAVRAHGGVALDPLVLPSGDRVAVCDDAQGAAFALFAPA